MSVKPAHIETNQLASVLLVVTDEMRTKKRGGALGTTNDAAFVLADFAMSFAAQRRAYAVTFSLFLTGKGCWTKETCSHHNHSLIELCPHLQLSLILKSLPQRKKKGDSE